MIRTHGVTHFDPSSCFGCKLQTIYLSPPAFQPHYNYSVGKWVNSDKEFRDELKRAAEANSIITGTYHNYEPRYPGDTQPLQAADQVLEDRARNLRALELNKPLPVTADND